MHDRHKKIIIVKYLPIFKVVLKSVMTVLLPTSPRNKTDNMLDGPPPGEQPIRRREYQ